MLRFIVGRSALPNLTEADAAVDPIVAVADPVVVPGASTMVAGLSVQVGLFEAPAGELVSTHIRVIVLE